MLQKETLKRDKFRKQSLLSKLFQLFLITTLCSYKQQMSRAETCSGSDKFPRFFGVDINTPYPDDVKNAVDFVDLFYFSQIDYIIVATNDYNDPKYAQTYGSFANIDYLGYITPPFPGLHFYPTHDTVNVDVSAYATEAVPQYFHLHVNANDQAKMLGISCFTQDITHNGGVQIGDAEFEQGKVNSGLTANKINGEVCSVTILKDGNQLLLVHFEVNEHVESSYTQPIDVNVIYMQYYNRDAQFAGTSVQDGFIMNIVHKATNGSIRFMTLFFQNSYYYISQNEIRTTDMILSQPNVFGSRLETDQPFNTQQKLHMGLIPLDPFDQDPGKILYVITQRFFNPDPAQVRIYFYKFRESTITPTDPTQLIEIPSSQRVLNGYQDMSSHVISSAYAGIHPIFARKQIFFGMKRSQNAFEADIQLVDYEQTKNAAQQENYIIQILFDGTHFIWSVTSIICESSDFGHCAFLFFKTGGDGPSTSTQYYLVTTKQDVVLPAFKIHMTRKVDRGIFNPSQYFRGVFYKYDQVNDFIQPAIVFNMASINFGNNYSPSSLQFPNEASFLDSHLSNAGCFGVISWTDEPKISFGSTRVDFASFTDLTETEKNDKSGGSLDIVRAVEQVFTYDQSNKLLFMPPFKCEDVISTTIAAVGIEANQNINCFLSNENNSQPLSPTNQACKTFELQFDIFLLLNLQPECRDYIEILPQNGLSTLIIEPKAMDISQLPPISSQADCDARKWSTEVCQAALFIIDAKKSLTDLKRKGDTTLILKGQIDFEKYKGVQVKMYMVFKGRQRKIQLAPFFLTVGKPIVNTTSVVATKKFKGVVIPTNSTQTAQTIPQTAQVTPNQSSTIPETSGQSSNKIQKSGFSINFKDSKIVGYSQSQNAGSNANSIQGQIEILVKELQIGFGISQKPQSVQQIGVDEQIPAKIVQFDIQTWMDKNGIKRQEQKSKNQNLNVMLSQKQLEKNYSVPKSNQISQTGDLNVDFSSDIIKPTPQKLYQKLLNDEQRQLQGIEEDVSFNMTQNSTEITVPVSLSENEQLEAIIKAGGLVSAKLIPGSDQDVEKKEFVWSLITFTLKHLKLQIKFFNPQYISMGEVPDKLEVIFNNTKAFLEPLNQDLEAIPNEYKLLVELPPQKAANQTYIVEEFKVKGNLQGFVVTQFILAFFMNMSLHQVFSAMITFQILAYIPLMNLNLPAQAYLFFETLSPIVTFDVLPLFDYIDIGFIETKPFSAGFQLLDFKSLNFVINIGSVLFIGIIMAIYFGLAYLIFRIGYVIKSQILARNFKMTRVKQSVLGFIYGICFDIMITVVLACLSFEFWPLFQAVDIWSNIFMAIFALALLSLIILVGYFSTVLASKIHTRYIGQKRKQFSQQLDHLRDSIERSIQRETETLMSTQNSEQSNINRQNSQKVLAKKLVIVQSKMEVLNQLKIQNSILIEKSDTLGDLDTQIYQSIVGKLRQNSQSALQFPVIFLTRRILIVSIIFLLKDRIDFQLHAFMAINLAKAIYQAESRPFDTQFGNKKELFIETLLLQCSVLLIILKMSIHSVTQQGYVGLLLVYVGTLNVIPILAITLTSMAYFLKNKIKELYRSIKIRKLSKNIKMKEEKIGKLMLQKMVKKVVKEKQRDEFSLSIEEIAQVVNQSRSSIRSVDESDNESTNCHKNQSRNYGKNDNNERMMRFMTHRNIASKFTTNSTIKRKSTATNLLPQQEQLQQVQQYLDVNKQLELDFGFDKMSQIQSSRNRQQSESSSARAAKDLVVDLGSIQLPKPDQVELVRSNRRDSVTIQKKSEDRRQEQHHHIEENKEATKRNDAYYELFEVHPAQFNVNLSCDSSSHANLEDQESRFGFNIGFDK